MKSKSFLILSLILIVPFFFSCQSSKNVSSKELISKITLEKITLGSSSKLEITKDEILNSSTNRDGVSDAVAGNITGKDWNEINKLAGKLDLSQIDQWEGPTQARFYDGAKATTIAIEANGQIYSSQSFDEGKPPTELQELYDYLESLVNQ